MTFSIKKRLVFLLAKVFFISVSVADILLLIATSRKSYSFGTILGECEVTNGALLRLEVTNCHNKKAAIVCNFEKKALTFQTLFEQLKTC